MTTVTEKNSAISSISPTVSEEMVQNMKDAIERQLRLTLARHSENATKREMWMATCLAVREQVVDRFIETQAVHNQQDVRRAYYLSLEYLMGRLLHSNICNLKLDQVVRKALEDMGFDYEALSEEEIKSAKIISSIINTDYYHVDVSSDVIGVEVSAAIKNIYSMAVGAAKGLCNNKISEEKKEQNYLNTASALFNQSIKEMEIFVSHLKGQKGTVTSLAGLGDLHVSSGGGRNSKMGTYLGDGLIYSEAKKTKMSKVTVEGAELIKEIGAKVKEEFSSDKLPIMMAMIESILDDKKLSINWEKF